MLVQYTHIYIYMYGGMFAILVVHAVVVWEELCHSHFTLRENVMGMELDISLVTQETGTKYLSKDVFCVVTSSLTMAQ